MKKRLLVSLTAISLALTLAIPAFAAGNGAMEQTQTQSQVQTQISTEDCDQAKLQVRDRLQVKDEAMAQYQQRLQLQDQDGTCFNDTAQHWARQQIQTAYNWGLVNGYPDGTYNPNGNITGTEGVLMMSRMMNCVNTDSAETVTGSDIDWDLVPTWARQQLQEQTALRIMEQCDCYGDQQMNRLQFAVTLAKALGVDPADVPEDTVVFLDQDDIPAEDLGYLYTLRAMGIVQGNNGCFYANQAVTRAEAATMLTRVMDILEE